MVKARLTDRGRQLSGAAAMVAAVAVSLASVLVLPPGHPIRIAAGLILFIALPGIGVELALLRPHTPKSPWERLAVVGALGLAASGLASVMLAVAGAPITETSVGAACASIAVFGSIVSLVGRGSPESRRHHGRTVRLGLVLVFVVSGGVAGSMIGSDEGADHFTILAFEDPLDARTAINAAAAESGRAILRIVVESHEADVEEYQLSVVGGVRSPSFMLQPSERRVLEIEVASTPAGSIEIQLLESGRVHRSLRLSSP